MPQSRLTDVNTACITYRTKCLMALDKKMYRNCVGAIKAMNSLLPQDDPNTEKYYRIIFDDEEYNKILNSAFKIECPECKKEIEYDVVRFDTINLPISEQIMRMKKTVKVWLCPLCHKMNRLEESEVIEDFIQRPFYSRFVPYPPINDHGLLSQLEFHTKMVDWVWICLDNLEEGFTRFRDDNWQRGGIMMDDPTIDTSIEETQA